MPTSVLPRITLVLGGQRSGKSAHAERLIGPDSGAVYIATCTAPADDAEMAARIERHRTARAEGWQTVEAPMDLASALMGAKHARAVMVDSLGMWVSNRMLAGEDVESALSDALEALTKVTVPVVLVSEEVGMGVVPENALARGFIDALGSANQRIADAADRVVLVVAGQALTVKA